jgi:hypothetical protein
LHSIDNRQTLDARRCGLQHVAGGVDMIARIRLIVDS